MKITATDFPGLFILVPAVYNDDRGYFFESFSAEHFINAGLNLEFKQDNQSKSAKGVLRGLHYQLKHGQGKLVRCVLGEIYDVALDIRKGSPTFGKVFASTLNDNDHQAVYVPPGFAHGFCVLSNEAIFEYKCTEKYYPEDEYGILWNDKTANIQWPIKEPFLSNRDMSFPALAEQDESLLPVFEDA